MNEKDFEKEVERQVRLKEAYENIFATEDGQLIIKDLAKQGYILSPLPLKQRDFGEGMRNIVLYIFSQANINPFGDE